VFSRFGEHIEGIMPLPIVALRLPPDMVGNGEDTAIGSQRWILHGIFR
jgi:hypothetical protein